MESEIDDDGPFVLYMQAINLLFSAVANRSLGDIERAESFLRASAAAGCDQAIHYLETYWPREKAAALRTIAG